MYVCYVSIIAHHKEHGCGRPNRGSVERFKMVDNLLKTKPLSLAFWFSWVAIVIEVVVVVVVVVVVIVY